MQVLTSCLRLGAAAITICSLSAVAQAQVAEDSSAEFKAQMEAEGAALGYPAAEATVYTHSNGMTSARLGLEAQQMLVVRQNPDGTFSYGHADTEAEAEAFMNNKLAESDKE